MEQYVILNADGSVTCVADHINIHEYAQVTGGNVILASEYKGNEKDIIASERLWRDSELSRADLMINKIQDGDSSQSIKVWRAYRKQLRAYPDLEGFPDYYYRPTSPDEVEVNDA